MSVVGWFFLVLVVLGFSELYLLVNVAARISFALTLGLCLLTGIVGGAFVRRQGLQTLSTIQRAVSQGEVPGQAIVSGLVLLIAGVLLLMPGFISDAVGFLLLVPTVRHVVTAWLLRRAAGQIAVNLPGQGPASPGSGWVQNSQIIDVDPDPDGDNGSSNKNS